MSIITQLGQFIPGSENYGHNQMNIISSVLDVAGGIIGSGGRKREEASAKREQASRQFDYENFDYNQDVGAINNPYAEAGQRQLGLEQQRIDQTQANQVQQLGRANQFGATTGIIQQSARANQDAISRGTNLQLAGKQFVEQQRQSRISDRYDQAETFLARSEQRLTAAKRARQKATEGLVKGIGGIATAAISGGIAGGFGGVGKFDWSAGLKGALKSDGSLSDVSRAPVKSVNALGPRPNKIIGDPVQDNYLNPEILYKR